LIKIGRILLLIPVFMLLTGAGCKAQTTSAAAALSPDITHRIETEIRSRYSVPPQIDISLAAPKSSEMPGYDSVMVTFKGGTHTTTHEFLLSKDRKTLAHLEKIDISQDLMSKIDVQGRPVRGNPNAKVTIINYDDFECPFCSRMHATLFPGLLQSYGDRVRVIYKDYPLVEIHPWAMHAAVDGNCLAAQNNDAYWDFADYVHANQREITSNAQGEQNWTQAFSKLDAIAKERAVKHKLDQQKFDACVKKQDDSAVRASMAEGDKLGVDSTPTMFINGERMSGAVPEDQLRSVLNRALADAGEKAPTASAKK
jgi:protein-disulfide isomerase